MDLAFDKRQHNVLQYIANNFDQVENVVGTNQGHDISGAKLNGLNFQNTDPSLLDRTANFFLEHKQVWLQSGTLRLALTNKKPNAWGKGGQKGHKNCVHTLSMSVFTVKGPFIFFFIGGGISYLDIFHQPLLYLTLLCVTLYQEKKEIHFK